MINRVVLIGRLTRDPELRKTNTNKSVVSFTMAVNRRFSANQQQQSADFLSCVAWNQSADFMANYLKKGALISIEGRLQSRAYDDANGKRVYVTEVVCDDVQSLETKSTNASTNNYQSVENTNTDNYENNESSYVKNSYSDDLLDIASDDLPF